MDNPKVCVYVPSHNTEKYLKDCLDSIISQTYSNMQIIIAEDASTDGSLDICKDYENHDSRIKVISYPSSHGSCGPINDALKDTDAEFIAKLDSDDIMAEKYWETVLPAFNSSTIGWVSIGLVNMEESGITSIRVAPPQYLQNPLDILEYNRFYAACPFRMKMFRQVGGWYMGYLHPDWAFWIKCIFAKWEWAYCMKGMYYYRHRKDSVVVSANNEKKLEAREFYKEKFKEDLDRVGYQPSPKGSGAIGIPKKGEIPNMEPKIAYSLRQPV